MSFVPESCMRLLSMQAVWLEPKQRPKTNFSNRASQDAEKRNLTLFYDPGNLKVVWWSNNSGAIQSEEALGHNATIGADGWPIDQRNPFAW